MSFLLLFSYLALFQLKNEGNVVANDAFWVVHACASPPQKEATLKSIGDFAGVAQGYDIAIASAGCKTDFVKSFLFRRVAPDVFNDVRPMMPSPHARSDIDLCRHSSTLQPSRCASRSRPRASLPSSTTSSLCVRTPARPTLTFL